MLDLIIKNTKSCTATDIFDCDIGIKDGKIVLLQSLIKEESKDTYNANGRFVLPGGIDAHCHIDQPMKDGSMCADNFESGTKSAAFGSVNLASL